MPILAQIPATIFVMQASSAESERHYSAFNARHIITPIRTRLCPDVVEVVWINLESYKNSLLWIKFSEFWLFSSNILGPGSGFIWVTWVQGQQKGPSFISKSRYIRRKIGIIETHLYVFRRTCSILFWKIWNFRILIGLWEETFRTFGEFFCQGCQNCNLRV